MSQERRRYRPSLRAAISNWNNSDLPFFRRLGVALANYSRRFRIPPQNCCGHPGDPGC
ncbi:MAG TPA: hypothetical protein VNL15_07445 [Dehalococcoidia bacterium]|nr:hypothetical protein [Dehalococcoidia bacterium]